MTSPVTSSEGGVRHSSKTMQQGPTGHSSRGQGGVGQGQKKGHPRGVSQGRGGLVVEEAGGASYS